MPLAALASLQECHQRPGCAAAWAPQHMLALFCCRVDRALCPAAAVLARGVAGKATCCRSLLIILEPLTLRARWACGAGLGCFFFSLKRLLRICMGRSSTSAVRAALWLPRCSLLVAVMLPVAASASHCPPVAAVVALVQVVVGAVSQPGPQWWSLLPSDSILGSLVGGGLPCPHLHHLPPAPQSSPTSCCQAPWHRPNPSTGRTETPRALLHCAAPLEPPNMLALVSCRHG